MATIKGVADLLYFIKDNWVLLVLETFQAIIILVFCTVNLIELILDFTYCMYNGQSQFHFQKKGENKILY